MKTGKYRHYKGNLYVVTGTARHSETEEEYVIYHPFGKSDLWVRPLQMFNEMVDFRGKMIPRFEFVEET